MPTATLHMTSDASELGVQFTAMSVYDPSGGPDADPWQYPPLPPGLERFTLGGRRSTDGRRVWLYLPKRKGEPELMPLLAACDWLRDRGWDVEGYGWCKTVLAQSDGGRT